MRETIPPTTSSNLVEPEADVDPLPLFFQVVLHNIFFVEAVDRL